MKLFLFSCTSFVCKCVVTFSLLKVCGPIMFLSVAFLIFDLGMLTPSLQVPLLFLVAYARKFLSLLVGLLEMTLLKSISAERSIVV